MKLVHYLSLILLLVASPSFLASVPVSIVPNGDGVVDAQGQQVKNQVQNSFTRYFWRVRVIRL